jgi:diguanylate cyclase (GGDEF)-like protein
MEITVEGPNPEVVQALTNATGLKTIEFIQQHYVGYSLEFLDPPYLPRTPFQPAPEKDAAVAGALGLVVGLLLASVRELIDRPSDAVLRGEQDPASTALKRSTLLRSLETYPDTYAGPMTVALIHLEGLDGLLHSLPRNIYRKLLRRVTGVLRSELRGKDQIARWNDTSFAVLLPNTTTIEASRLLERVQQELAQPISIFDNEETVQLLPHVGATHQRSNEASVQAVVQAEKALGRAGSSGFRPVFYSPEVIEDQTAPVKVQ